MFGQVPFAQIIFGQNPGDHPIILPAWEIQCPEEDGWFRLSQQKSVVEKCKPGLEEGAEDEPPIILPPE